MMVPVSIQYHRFTCIVIDGQHLYNNTRMACRQLCTCLHTGIEIDRTPPVIQYVNDGTGMLTIS